MDGALAPMDGMGDVESWEGNIHDAASCWKDMTVGRKRCYRAQCKGGLDRMTMARYRERKARHHGSAGK